MKNELRLDVAIVTWRREGIERVAKMYLPRIEGVRYLVSWQRDGDLGEVPEALSKREDVEVIECAGVGGTVNRENARLHCKAEIMLLSDDDLIYTEEGLRSIIKAFEERPEMDCASFMVEGEGRYYPAEEVRLGKRYPKGFSVTAFQLALRRRAYKRVGFDVRFGIGAPVWQSGEEDVLLYDLRKRGYDCRHIPIVICEHNHPSTGFRAMTPGVAAAVGKVISMEYPLTWPVRILLKAWRRRESGFWFNLRHELRGILSRGSATPK